MEEEGETSTAPRQSYSFDFGMVTGGSDDSDDESSDAPIPAYSFDFGMVSDSNPNERIDTTNAAGGGRPATGIVQTIPGTPKPGAEIEDLQPWYGGVYIGRDGSIHVLPDVHIRGLGGTPRPFRRGG